MLQRWRLAEAQKKPVIPDLVSEERAESVGNPGLALPEVKGDADKRQASRENMLHRESCRAKRNGGGRFTVLSAVHPNAATSVSTGRNSVRLSPGNSMNSAQAI